MTRMLPHAGRLVVSVCSAFHLRRCQADRRFCMPRWRPLVRETSLRNRFAEDVLKAVHRLPGAASNGLAGLAHMRGGDTNETLVILDGLPLYEPFHLRMLQSPSSVLDERIVDGLDVFAGGFTAEYGDRMSAIIDAR